jgi:glycosyltransferase involved in cell wall biosynthesis
LKVALVVPEFPPDTTGGGGPVFESLARALVRRGHRVRVLTSSTHGGPVGDDDRYEFAILRIPQLPHFQSRLRTYMPPSPRYYAAAGRFLSGTEIYHLHGYGFPFIDAVFHFLTPPARAVFTTHGFPYSVHAGPPLLTAAYNIYDAVAGRRILRRSRFATAVSTALAREAADVSGRDVVPILNGFVPLPAAETLDARFATEIAKGPYLFGVGRLEERKGFQFLIEALAILRSQGARLRLLLAGADNGYGGYLRSLARERKIEDAVSFLGNVPRAQLASLYRSAAAVVVSSRVETFGLVTLEAMAYAVPCVASAVGGILDVVINGENALLFTAGDAPGLAVRVQEILASSELRERLSTAGQATLARFSWDRVAGNYEALYAAAAA